MKKITLRFATAAIGAAFSLSAAAAASYPPRATLTAFAGETELAALFEGWAEEHKRRIEAQRRRAEEARAHAGPAPAQAPGSALGMAAKSAAADAVTNVQHAGVDEGGIVKVHGEHLVILRRGRLFTVAIGDQDLKPIAWADAYGGRLPPGGAWYDEMLIHGDTVIVIGYSYARGGTEIGLFDIDADGGLRYRSTHHLRSNDYYSSRNYASRLVGDKLVFYTPLRLNPFAANPYAAFPALRRWREGAAPADFRRIAPATRIYRTDEELDPYQGVALHSVTVCDLAARAFNCEASAVMGAPGRVFYVSPDSVYVWTTAWRRGRSASAPASALFRIPLDGGAPSALKVSGSPVDQFSFLDDGAGMLNVLVRANARGDGMWAAEASTVSAGDVALLRVPLASFSDGREAASSERYTPLPRPAAGGAFQNRYVGAYLLYGTGAGWRRPQARAEGQVYAVRHDGGREAFAVPLGHGVDRIEALGDNAVVVGSDGRDLHFTSLRLSNFPVAVNRYTRANAAQGETRSHGFFYQPDSDYGGLLGLPIIGGGEGARRQLRKESASLLFLRNESLALAELGALDARPDEASRNDGCRASCVDWYGNSRPLFLRQRVFALLGYELVEGRLAQGRIAEARRVNFAPRSGDYAVRIAPAPQ
ncbi:MAG: beta-propeller domain-containing protein [Burkholderiales bacterium]